MKRRDFLKTSMLGMAAFAGPGFLSKTAMAAFGKGKTLVVVQLSGGNDALNTLVPFTNGAYYAARPSLGIARKDVLPLSNDVGLNPNLKALMNIWDAGELALVQGVGYPNPNRSHFESMAIWHTADPSTSSSDAKPGWIGRLAEKYADPFCASNFGGVTPQALRGSELILPSINGLDRYQLSLEPSLKTAFSEMLTNSLDGRAESLRRNTLQMLQNTAKVQGSLYKYKSGSAYDEDNQLATNLRDVARMIATEVGPRVFYTSLGGFDTHAAQPIDHPVLLEKLASGLAAFKKDIEAQGKADEVLLIVFSEFGRRLAENASSGTDHGKAGLMLVLGKGVKGGLYGQYPDLDKLDDGDPRFTTDFRQVYAESLDVWLKVSSKDILGTNFMPLQFLK